MKWHYTFDDLPADIDWAAVLPIILPVMVITFLLALFALIDLYIHRHMRRHVLLWSVAIICISILGPVLYFSIGRKEV